MLFYLTSLHVSYVLTDSEPIDPYAVDGQNLTFATAREIWESLEKKYMTQLTQVVCSKKFIVGKFLNFKMNDAKPVVKHVEELQIIVHEMEVELDLKHLTSDMSFEQLVLKIRVEEDNRVNEKAYANSIEPIANIVKESSSKSKSNHKNKGINGGGSRQKHSKGGKRITPKKRTTTSIKSIIVGSVGNLGIKLRIVATRKSMEAEILEEIPKEFVGVIESFLTTNVVDWWFDTGATKHISNSRRMFVTYQKVNEPKPMFMGNETASKIEGKGKVILKLTSGKDLVLLNVLYVPNITKNLISSPILRAPRSLWGEACLAANTILNKIPHKKSDKSPYWLWKGKQPSYKRMEVWGCLEKVQIPLPKRTKLGP
ncbi:hypothetical protein Tco_0110964 [Tanacetum coccineum]